MDMPLAQLMAGLDIGVEQGSAAAVVRDLTDDSRQVTEGSLFIARAGVEADGRRYIADAVARGAAAVLAPSPLGLDVPADVVVLTADRVDQALAGELAERFFGRPAEKLKLIGVTGTNGKTTTACLVRHLLAAAGVRCGLIGTVAVDDGGSADCQFPIADFEDVPDGPASTSASARSEIANRKLAIPPNTTPGAVEFSRLLARMVENGCTAAVAEISSHALAQGRVAALRFHAAVFTNLTGDHLDYHGSMDAYADAKARLFEQVRPEGWAILNADDPAADRMIARFAGRPDRVLRCRVSNDHLTSATNPPLRSRQRAGVRVEPPHAAATDADATIDTLTAAGSVVQFVGPFGSVEATLPLVGEHNVANALQAVAAAQSVCDLRATLADALARCPQVPGRLERVAPLPSPERRGPGADLPTVLVDYAHTHDALDNVLRALRPLTDGRLIVLFGCGGDRDRTKRPKMARVAQQWADVVYVTSDNPRSEDPQRIIDDIVAGFARSEIKNPKPQFHIEPDRAAAIRAAIGAAGVNDTVLLAGKGHEDYQIVGDDRRHFDDREHAAAALARWRVPHAGRGVAFDPSEP